MWCKEDLTTEEQAKKNRELNNGKIFSMEDTAAHDDDWDVNIGLAGSGVVHALRGPNHTTGGTS